MSEMQEFVTLTVHASDGREVELAVVDEFDYGKKHYVVGSLVEGDEVSSEGVYIYEYVPGNTDEEFSVKPITSKTAFREISEAYQELQDEESQG